MLPAIIEKFYQCMGGLKTTIMTTIFYAFHVNLVFFIQCHIKWKWSFFPFKVTYNYKIKLEKSSGDPMNSHCECPSGKGPHGTCKHVAAVMLMLQEFVNTGDIEVEKSCTDSLQMFHKPRCLYSGIYI